MKKIASLFFLFGLLTLTSCTGSNSDQKEDDSKDEQRSELDGFGGLLNGVFS